MLRYTVVDTRLSYSLREKDLSPGNSLSLVFLGNKYLYWMQVCNYSSATIQGRGFCLDLFIRWCYDQGITLVSEVTRPVLDRYLAYLYTYCSKRRKQKLHVLTLRQRIGLLRSYFRWLTKNDTISYNPASTLVLPKYSHRLPAPLLSVAEVEQILNVPNLDTPLGLRDRAILELLYSSGIRRQELLGLTIQDVDLERGILIVMEGKGKKDRYVPVTERACRWLGKYLTQARPMLSKPGRHRNFLFLTKGGTPFTSPAVLSTMVRKLINQSPVSQKGACHLFRHTMATLMLENGADVRYIQEILGHAYISSTQIYTHVSLSKLQQVHALTHPANIEAKERQTHRCPGEKDEQR